jgi:hypothetical protein
LHIFIFTPKITKVYHEDHEGHEVKKYFMVIFVPLRVLRGEWKNLTLVSG